MSEHSQYRNPVDQQLSQFVEGDRAFKSELIGIYSKYMVDIQREFAQLVNQKNLEGLALLHHKHKTTFHVLALSTLSDVFERTRRSLDDKCHDDKLLSEFCNEVDTMCNATLVQLQEI